MPRLLRTLFALWHAPSRIAGRGRLTLVVTVTALATLAAPARSVEPFAETEVKAAFIYNFVHFVRWPDLPGRKPGDPFRFCVLDDTLAPLLAKAVQGESIDGHPLTVSRPPEVRVPGDCQILYIGEAAWPLQPDLLRRATVQRVLTVSDVPTFAEKGGMIALVRKRGRIHPVINIDAVSRAELRISAKLLNLATVVGDDKGGAE